ncbi:peroxiredoxin [Fulvivirga lutimaris]|uniref:peroxiredoxin n=1 Tax=Fulvivirga lutimaris TaxID=1819566 RepID=UPI0012BC74FA|nr:peroxiredoxin [Fulvivirga lutimaris]MTI38363.1 peroxiredoxin [Fulvivirga lutimaris]
MALSKGTKAPNFSLPSTDGSQFTLSNHENEPLLIYFYPLDFTPGCTKEACSFRDNFEFFRNADIKVFGISTDSIEKHLKFKKKHNLPFELLSDKSGKVSKLYGAVIPFVGISKRVTYLLNGDHNIVGVYDNLFGYEKHIKEMIKQINKDS